MEALARFLSQWRVELLIGLLIGLAIFLLVERMQIRQTLLGWLRQALGFLESFGGSLAHKAVSFLRNTTLSDLTGYVLLLIALVVVAWRVRWRLIHAPRFSVLKCPHCQGELHRVHRRTIDRVVSLYVPVARYRCRTRDCMWTGLRIKKARHE
jgi:hypothetical protein